MSYLLIFLQSNLLELPLYLWVWVKFAKRAWPEGLAIFTGMNAITHPFIFFVVLSLPLNYLQGILLAEGVAITSEAVFLLWLTGLSAPLCLGVSLAANLISWQLAPILTYLWAGYLV